MNELLSKLTIADYGIMASWVVSLGYWIVLLRKRAGNQLPLVAPESRPRTFWSMAEFFVCLDCFALRVCGPAFWNSLLVRSSSADDRFGRDRHKLA